MSGMDGIEYDQSFKQPQLAKTVAFSPVIKQIFEANLRTPDSRDIIFIKVSCIIRLDTYRLESFH